MAKFDAGKAVESLEYDFTDYGGSSGVIPEPSTARINGFFANLKAIMGETKQFRELLNAKDDDEADITPEMMEQMEQAGEFTEKMQDRMTEAVAILCGAEWVDDPEDCDDDECTHEGHFEGGSPSLDELRFLPFRVQQAFNQWLMGELRPKKTTPGTKR